MGEKFLEIDGKKVSYIEEGKGETLVLIHGWMGSSTQGFKYIAPKLSKHFHVLAVNLPGFGGSEELNCSHTIEAYADFTFSFLKKKKITSVYLVGCSLGGAICLKFIEKYPEYVKKIILQSSPFRGADFDIAKRIIAKILKIELMRSIFGNYARKKIFDSLKNDTSFQRLNREAQEVVKQDMKKTSIKVAAESINSLFDDNLTITCQSICIPAMIIDGEHGKIVSPKVAEKLNKLINNSKLVILKDAGHNLPLEKPEEFSREILEFLK